MQIEHQPRTRQQAEATEEIPEFRSRKLKAELLQYLAEAEIGDGMPSGPLVSHASFESTMETMDAKAMKAWNTINLTTSTQFGLAALATDTLQRRSQAQIRR